MIYLPELPGEPRRVQEWTQVKPYRNPVSRIHDIARTLNVRTVVIWTVRFLIKSVSQGWRAATKEHLPHGTKASTSSSCACYARARRRTVSPSPRSVCVELSKKNGVPRSRPTWTGDKNEPHSCTNFVNMLYGPHFSTFRSRPKTESSSYVMPMSACKDIDSVRCITQG